MPEQCSVIINLIDQLAPRHLAESWDNVGLQVGGLERSISKVMVCLEVTNEVIDEAVSKNIDLILTHHPLIFKPIKSIRQEDGIGKMIHRLIKHEIALYCAHTNLDVAYGGLNDVLAQALNLENIEPLVKTYSEKYFKLVVFIPETHIDEVREAVGNAGGGQIGNYSHCAFQTLGEGTFKPLNESNPFIGEQGKLESVREYRLEVIVEETKLNAVIKSMLQVHPYEEVAYDILPLNNEIKYYGMGRMGMLPQPMAISLLCEEIKRKLELHQIRLVGDVNKEIQKVGLCTGSGSEYILNAFKAGCDCFITGDLKYHEAQYALQLGVTVIDAGHFEIENFAFKAVAEYLMEKVEELQFDVEVVESATYINPFQTV